MLETTAIRELNDDELNAVTGGKDALAAAKQDAKNGVDGGLLNSNAVLAHVFVLLLGVQNGGHLL